MFGLALAATLVASRCDVFVMAPLWTLNSQGEIAAKDKMNGWFQKMQSGGIDGLMLDIWWGLVETDSKTYKWDGYVELINMLKACNLKIVPVMSFHKCGGNVGDDCNIPIPQFVLNSAAQPFYKDSNGNIDNEAISLGWDDISIDGRTPIEMYSDFMKAFRDKFQSEIDDGTIVEIEIGTGPCGELRYPSYQMKYWSYPGCGGFQAFDDELTKQLAEDAKAEGKENYGHHPTNDGGYNSRPDGSDYWKQDGDETWKSAYGMWYQSWYTNKLITHGGKVLNAAREAFGPKVELSTKISGIHWWYTAPCHCAENTAGLRNYQDTDGYRDFMTMFKKYDIQVCFTCLEMTPNSGCGSNPPALVQQIADDCKWAGLKFEGENALECYDWDSYMRIKGWISSGLSRYTHLRMGDNLMNDNWNTFVSFAQQMHG